jgi:hypothetical protein
VGHNSNESRLSRSGCHNEELFSSQTIWHSTSQRKLAGRNRFYGLSVEILSLVPEAWSPRSATVNELDCGTFQCILNISIGTLNLNNDSNVHIKIHLKVARLTEKVCRPNINGKKSSQTIHKVWPGEADIQVDPKSRFSHQIFIRKVRHDTQRRFLASNLSLESRNVTYKSNDLRYCTALPSLHRCSIASTDISRRSILLSIHPALSHSRPLMAHHHPIFIFKRDDWPASWSK